MQNINPSKHRNRRATFYLFVVGLPVIMIGCISMVSVALLSQLPLFGNFNTLAMILLAILSLPALIGGSIATYRGMTLAKDNEQAYRVGEFLQQSIGADPRYKFIRNVSRRGLGYIDAVLVGPPGALVFRTVDYKGLWRNERADWKVINPKNGKLRPAPANPSQEVARDVYALRKFLKGRKLDKVPVYGVVVFTDPQVTLQADGPVVPVTKTNRLYEIINRDFLQEERINLSTIESTVDAIIEG